MAKGRDFSEKVASAIDEEARNIVNERYQKAKDLLTEKRDKLDALAEALLEKETIEADEFNQLMSDKNMDNDDEEQQNES